MTWHEEIKPKRSRQKVNKIMWRVCECAVWVKVDEYSCILVYIQYTKYFLCSFQLFIVIYIYICVCEFVCNDPRRYVCLSTNEFAQIRIVKTEQRNKFQPQFTANANNHIEKLQNNNNNK